MKKHPCTYKLKDLNGPKIIGSFYEKEMLLSMLLMSYYPELDSHIRRKFKAVLNLSKYATRRELDRATRVDISDLAVKKDLLL